MNRLLLDVGNTRVKWGRMRADFYEFSGAVALDGLSVEGFLQQVWPDVNKPDQVIISSVTDGDWMRLLRFCIANSWSSVVLEVVSESKKAGLTNGYAEPCRLGVDRWCALLGAWNEQHSAVCVIDAGTALTMDVVNNGGEHLGGLIVPGLRLMRECLLNRTAKVSRQLTEDEKVEIQPSIDLLGKNTAQAVAGGALWTLAAGVERLQSQAFDLVGGPMRCVITGGDAQQLLPLLSGDWEWKQDLVLRGLQAYAKS